MFTVFKVILDGVFQNFMSTDKSIFNITNNLTSITSIDPFIIISLYIFVLKT